MGVEGEVRAGRRLLLPACSLSERGPRSIDRAAGCCATVGGAEYPATAKGVLPLSPCISLCLTVSPSISLYLPVIGPYLPYVFLVLLPVSRDEGGFDYSSLVGGDAAASRGEQVEQVISSAANVRTRQRAQQEADAEERERAAAAARGREMRAIQERLGRLNSERCKIRQLATSASTRTANAHLLQGLDDEEAELVATLERLRLLAETESGRQPDRDACRRAASRPPPRRRSQPAAGSSSAASQAGGGQTQPTQVLQSVASAAQRVLRDDDSDASRSDGEDEGEETGAASGASSEESEGGETASSGSASSEDDMLDPSE